MRSTKNAVVQFGVSNIQVAVAPATTNKDSVTFSNLHRDCLNPVKQPKTCVTCHRTDLTADDLVKGYQFDKGQYVTFEASELEEVEARRSKFLKVEKFIPQTSAISFKKSYYLIPDEGYGSSYGAILYGMEETKTVAFGHSSLWGKEYPFVLTPFHGVMGFHILFTNNEIVHPDFLIERPDSPYIKQAKLAIKEWSDDLDTTDLVSAPDLLLKAMLDAKVAGEEFSSPAVEEVTPPSVDLIEALRATMALAPKRLTKV